MGLQARQLALARGNRPLFEGLDFEVGAGEALRVLGPNGSGKTSLLRVVCGLSCAHGGEVRWRGQLVDRARADVQRDLLYIGHAPGLKDDLSACENLQFSARCSGRACSHEQALRALTQLGLRPHAHLPARVLSQGQRRRVVLARLALESAPRLVVLDEPFTALDTDAVALVAGLLRLHLAAGSTLLYTTHHAHQALAGQTRPTRELQLGAAPDAAWAP